MVCGWLLWSRIPVSCCQLCIVELDQRQMLHTSWAPRKKNIVNDQLAFIAPPPTLYDCLREKNTIRRKCLQALHLRCIFEDLKKCLFLFSLHLPIFWWHKLKYSRGTGPPHWVFYVEQEGVDFIIKTSWLNFVSLTLSLHYVIICTTIFTIDLFWPQNDLNVS